MNLVRNMTKSKSNKLEILGIGIDNISIESANLKIQHFVNNHKDTSYYVVKPYVSFMVKANSDSKIKEILNNADLVLPDGVSLQWAGSYLYGRPKKAFLKLIRSLLFWMQKPDWRNQILSHNFAGPNQTIPLLKIAEDNNWKIGIIGGNLDEVNTRTKNLETMFPRLKNIYCWQGYLDIRNNKHILKGIENKNLDILFVAMGFPKQEQFIYNNIDNNLATVMIGEGGTFDYNELGGKTKRASHNVQKFGLEWLWRIIIQPKRLIRVFDIIKFIYLINKYSREIKN